ncbi:MAG: flagellar hook-basal body protein [Actinobacteria bacterium]|nr:flagellar hook-basal body protein [Actinomycetota bacterium]
MNTALSTAAAGMEAQQAWMDALSNDIANVSTTGYKSLRVGFRDLLYQSPGRGGAAGTATGAGAAAQIVGQNSAQGALEATERPLDVALTTPGFIQVQAPGGGVALTRDGNLQIGPDGQLRTATGQALEPPVRIPKGVDPEDVSIAPDGTVSAGRRALGRIPLVEVTNPNGLQADGENGYLPTAASGPVRTAVNARVQQGTLEASNVDLGTVMTAMTEAQQGYALAGKAVTTQDEVLAVANGLIR